MFDGGFPAFGFGGRQPPQEEEFEETYRCNSITFLPGKEDKENGDKIILPASAFEKLANMTVTYPMQFELRNENQTPVRHTHVGVLEFTAPEGRCYVPHWIMQNLLLMEDGHIVIKNVTLKHATYVKFRPQSKDFLDISNPKAVLEFTLRNFSCMTKDDQICLQYNEKNYFLDVVDVKPDDAVSIVEADVKVDFEAPVGYDENLQKLNQEKEDKTEKDAPIKEEGNTVGKSESNQGAVSVMAKLALERAERARKKQLEDSKASYTAFSGSGMRVDGKSKEKSSKPLTNSVTAPPPPVKKTGKWRSKVKGSSFMGQGRSLAD